MDRFEKLLRQKVLEIRGALTQTMTISGYNSLEEYKYGLGYIRALDVVLDNMDVISEDMRK